MAKQTNVKDATATMKAKVKRAKRMKKDKAVPNQDAEKKKAKLKLKKKKKKESKKLPKSRGDEDGCGDGDGDGVALVAPGLQYLQQWKSRATSGWKFNKSKQIWILKNLYDRNALPRSYFKIALQYLDGLQGNQRNVLKNQAKTILEKEDGDAENDKTYRKQCKRAQKILEVLVED